MNIKFIMEFCLLNDNKQILNKVFYSVSISSHLIYAGGWIFVVHPAYTYVPFPQQYTFMNILVYLLNLDCKIKIESAI